MSTEHNGVAGIGLLFSWVAMVLVHGVLRSNAAAFLADFLAVAVVAGVFAVRRTRNTGGQPDDNDMDVPLAAATLFLSLATAGLLLLRLLHLDAARAMPFAILILSVLALWRQSIRKRV